jgi:hypothetical protein
MFGLLRRVYQPVAIILGAAVLALTSVAPATTVMPTNLAELADNAEKAFVGTITGQEVVRVGTDGWGERITAEVTDGIRGTSVGEKVSWTQYRMGEHARLVGMPEYVVGRSYVIFLSAKAAGSPYTAPVSLGQGVFQISTGSDGAVRARNQFNNAHVYAGVNVRQLAPVAAPGRAVVKLAGGTTAGAQTELGTLVAHSRALVAAPQRKAVSKYGRPAREVVPLGLPGQSKDAAVPSVRVP